MNSITNQIGEIICKNEGKIFAINDFYKFGTKNTIKSILYRLSKENKITRIADGLYVKPRYNKILKKYSYPSPHEFAEKIAEKFSWKIVPTGETALNYTNLSTQVSNEYIYVSSGGYKEYCYQNKKIIFKHTTNRNIMNYSDQLLILIQAIKRIGQKNIKEKHIKMLARFAKNIKEDLIKDTLNLPFWIYEILVQIAKLNC
ncbi:DUF6088 family protein [Mycoplasmopsis gallopavonis]|uniref:Abortive infection protein AbiGI n=1 Tax=Mycoplasmopsis gallopavonis TaxID=76629 RepID=A0A449B042_9BACT|nr:DUF6088 family protein [Mycoplasmopsis gallopavonis]RIV16857.1 hypothetical protein D1113_00750 [Mycoplasmopsis gallopavonis]VEU73161.1 Uncharacterised protein [Mycoplasmopsis gallopavonis]